MSAPASAVMPRSKLSVKAPLARENCGAASLCTLSVVLSAMGVGSHIARSAEPEGTRAYVRSSASAGTSIVSMAFSPSVMVTFSPFAERPNFATALSA